MNRKCFLNLDKGLSWNHEKTIGFMTYIFRLPFLVTCAVAGNTLDQGTTQSMRNNGVRKPLSVHVKLCFVRRS